MPTYSFRCPKCLCTAEESRPLGSVWLPRCPDCGATMNRLFTAVGIIFKGSGWASKDK